MDILPHQDQNPLPTFRPLLKCPSSGNGLTFPSYFFRFPNISNFWICSKCFNDSIVRSPLADSCERFYYDPLPGEVCTCDWQQTPRAIQLLRNVDVDAVLQYARQRAAAGACPAQQGVPGGQGFKWFGSSDMPSFVACEACHLDYILAMPDTVARRFHRVETNDYAGGTWSCDISVPYIKRCFLQHGLRAEWSTLVTNIRHRMSLPTYFGFSGVTYKNSRKWIRPVIPRPIQEMMACEACFLDHAGGIPVAGNFGEVSINVRDGMNPWICDFKLSPLVACTPDFLKRSYDLWHGIAAKVVKLPACEQQTSKGGEWYALQHPKDPRRIVEDFDICAGCYAGMIQPYGFAKFFPDRSYSPETERTCDMSPLNAGRYHIFRAK